MLPKKKQSSLGQKRQKEKTIRTEEILKKANEVEEVLHLKSKEAEKEGDVQITLVILKDSRFNKKKINIIKEEFVEAMFDRNILLPEHTSVEICVLEYKKPEELEIILLGVQRKYNVEDFYIID